MGISLTANSPISEMNTTPLIDVMLVLLIMFIITIPIQTHSVGVDLPSEGDMTGEILPINTVAVTSGGVVLWNGVPVSYGQLRRNLSATMGLSPTPELRFEPDANARYVVVDSVLATIRRAGVETMGFVGNERYAREF